MDSCECGSVQEPEAKKKAEPPLCFFPTSITDPVLPYNLGNYMNFNPEIVAQAKAFVNALKSGKRAHMPALRFEFWQQFMTTVNAELGIV